LRAACSSALSLSKGTLYLCIHRDGLSPVHWFPLHTGDAPAFMPSSTFCSMQPAYPAFLAICAPLCSKPALLGRHCAEVNAISPSDSTALSESELLLFSVARLPERLTDSPAVG